MTCRYNVEYRKYSREKANMMNMKKAIQPQWTPLSRGEMKKTSSSRRIVVLTALVFVASSAQVHSTPIGLVAAALGAAIDPGTAPIASILGTVTGGFETTGFQTTPFVAPLYDFTVPSPMGAAAGNLIDFHWIHESSGAFVAPALGTMWTFGGASGTDFILYPSIDHGPVVEESLETTLYGSSDGGATWTVGTITTLYALGASAASPDDDTAQLWRFPSPVSLISGTAGLAQGTYSFASTDTEVDAIGMIVPEPSEYGLLGVAIAVMGVAYWRRTKTAKL